MKAPIVRLFALVVVLFGVLVGFTSYWSVFAADQLRTNTANRRDERVAETPDLLVHLAPHLGLRRVESRGGRRSVVWRR